jgi:imidazoleglycerol phosphate dehydratase HisB
MPHFWNNHHQVRSKFKRLETIIRYAQSSKDWKSSSGTLKVQRLETIIRYAQSSQDWKPSSAMLKVQQIGNHHQVRSKFKRLETQIT